jgi:hypothetical protein
MLVSPAELRGLKLPAREYRRIVRRNFGMETPLAGFANEGKNDIKKCLCVYERD